MPCWQGFNALFEQLLLYRSPYMDSNKKPQKVLECSCVDFCLLCSTITSWVVALTVTLGSCKVRPLEFWRRNLVQNVTNTWSMCQGVTKHLVNVSKRDQKPFSLSKFDQGIFHGHRSINCTRWVLFVIHYWHCFDCDQPDHSTHLTCHVRKIGEDRTRNVCSRTWRAHGAY